MAICSTENNINKEVDFENIYEFASIRANRIYIPFA